MAASGKRAERRAALWYRLRGYRVLARNAWVVAYVLDLFVRLWQRLVFAEVKAKAGDGFGDPAEMVGPEKQRRLRRAASAWLAAHPEHCGLSVSFEVIAMQSGRLRRIAEAF